MSMVHSNFTPIGRKTPDFPGGIIPNHSVNGAVEWAYGVKPTGLSRGFISRCTPPTRRGAAGR